MDGTNFIGEISAPLSARPLWHIISASTLKPVHPHLQKKLFNWKRMFNKMSDIYNEGLDCLFLESQQLKASPAT